MNGFVLIEDFYNEKLEYTVLNSTWQLKRDSSEKCRGLFALLPKLPKLLSGPKYNGKYLRNLLSKFLGEKRLHETITNVVIPTFDIKRLQPTIFSSYQVSHFFAQHID